MQWGPAGLEGIPFESAAALPSYPSTCKCEFSAEKVICKMLKRAEETAPSSCLRVLRLTDVREARTPRIGRLHSEHPTLCVAVYPLFKLHLVYLWNVVFIFNLSFIEILVQFSGCYKVPINYVRLQLGHRPPLRVIVKSIKNHSSD